ncbi:MAG: DNA polymerase III subunit, partial [Candidatus Aminicenantes bacterium]|nr:DNA polymerase III subunit [Candidatus Aminicenantes bacterium]
MPFKDIPGNGRVKDLLRMALAKNRLPNSLLFCGPEGVGKTAAARTLAQALNCLRLKDDACGACDACLAIADALGDRAKAGKFPDVMAVGLLPGKKEIAIEQTRELKTSAYLRPMAGRSRVFLIEDAELMSGDAANSILKVLEEPPLSSHIILVTAHPELLLPTIVSRCRVLTFLTISIDEIERALLDRGLPAAQARTMALLSRGNLDQALALDWDEAMARREQAWRAFLALAADRDVSPLLRLWAYAPRGAVRDEIVRAMDLFAGFLRDVLYVKNGGPPEGLLNPDAPDRVAEAGR